MATSTWYVNHAAMERVLRVQDADVANAEAKALAAQALKSVAGGGVGAANP